MDADSSKTLQSLYPCTSSYPTYRYVGYDEVHGYKDWSVFEESASIESLDHFVFDGDLVLEQPVRRDQFLGEFKIVTRLIFIVRPDVALRAPWIVVADQAEQRGEDKVQGFGVLFCSSRQD